MRTRSVAALSLALAQPLAPASGQQLTATERAQAVATVWAEARYNFAYWDRVQADWDSALAANLQLVAQPQSDVLFYRRLRRFVALLGDGQAAVTPPANLRSRIARPPLLVQSVERRPFILDYVPNDEMRVARPERRAEIVAVQGVAADEWIRDSVVPEISAATPADRWQRAVAWMLLGEKGTALQLSLKSAGGIQRGISATRSVSLNDRWPFDPPDLQVDTLPDSVVLVRVNSLGDDEIVRRFDRAVDGVAAMNGLILDLRSAVGGTSEYGYEILGRLVKAAFLTARWKTPQYRAVFRVLPAPPRDSALTWYGPPPASVSPRADRAPYAGPIAVLASAATSGAAEDLLVAFRAAGRGVIIGEPSAGSPGEAVEIQLPKNWTVRFAATRHAFPNGTEFAGSGIKPEVTVLRTVADLLAGRDAAVEKAREYLRSVGGGKGRQGTVRDGKRR